MVPVDIILFRIEDLTSGSNDDRPCLNRHFSFLVLKVDGLGRTEFLADLASSFREKDAVDRVDGIFQRNRLGILDVNRFSLADARIVLIINLRRAFLRAKATGDTFLRVHIPGVLNHLDLKISFLPGDALHLRQRQELNIQMPADLDQFGGKDSHSAVIGGEGLVQLRHDPTDGGRSLYEIDIKAGVGQVQGCLHSGNSSSNHHH
jgi:hypothetical protein